MPSKETAADSSVLGELIAALPELSDHHAPGSRAYRWLERAARREVEALFGDHGDAPKNFAPFGPIIFPYRKMGAIDSLDILSLDELIIFSFYWANRQRYKKAVDIGANIGLHSLLMSRAGFDVTSFEPDPEHFKFLSDNLSKNRCGRVRALNLAVSNKAGKSEFVRVIGNTTANHLAGSKKNPYGPMERIVVNLEAVENLRGAADLFKIDAEGHEKDILLATDRDFWSQADALVEVGSAENAEAIYNHFKAQGVNMFCQKINWGQASRLADMPTSYREGTLFISSRGEMPWYNAS